MTLSDTDQIELQQLLMRYTHALDHGSIDAMDEIWTEDCEFQVDHPEFHARGLDHVKDMLRSTTRDFPQVRHIVTNCFVEVINDEVFVNSYLQILDRSELKITAFARYVDLCVRLPQGWRIKHRTCLSR